MDDEHDGAIVIGTGDTRGFMKAIVDADSGQILGCAVLGSEGGEIMTMIQLAMLGKLTHTLCKRTAASVRTRIRSWHRLLQGRRRSRQASALGALGGLGSVGGKWLG